MTQFRKSVARPAPGAGAPKGKNPNATQIFVDDILFFPPTDAGGIKLLGSIVLKPGARMERIYLTDESQKISHKYEGDADAGGYMKMVEASHPGDELEINEYVQNTNEVPVLLIYDLDCNTNLRKVVGLPCNPLYLKASFEDSKDGVKHTLTYEQRRRDRHLSKFYEGELTFGEAVLVADATDVDLITASGLIYSLPTSAVATVIAIGSNDIAHKKVVTLIGNGGTTPATLSGSTNLLLDNGAQWVAEKDAVINLQVYDAGATTYLIEISRG